MRSEARFVAPLPGDPTPVRFPPIARTSLPNGLRIWVIRHSAVPAVSVAMIVRRGSAHDPAGRYGLASLTGDLLDEGAGARDAITLADAFGALGTDLETDISADASVLSVTVLSRLLRPVLGLLADVIMRPRIAAADFERIRDLRVNRLRQLRTQAGASADRAFGRAVFPGHPYGHGTLGTTSALEQMSVDDPAGFWGEMYAPGWATVIAVGDVDEDACMTEIADVFGEWRGPAPTFESSVGVPPAGDQRLLLVDRPGAPQSELRIGHVAPGRKTDAFHALVTLNAVVGGQFTSRLNRRLREEKGVTYGARTAFEFRRAGGIFSCDTSVQTDATAASIADVLAEFERVRTEPIDAAELALAKASLTRGYVRNFETSDQLLRGAAQLATHDLPDDTFDRFVPAIEAVTAANLEAAARGFIHADTASIVVVGDAATCEAPLAELGRPVTRTTPEF